MKSGDRGIEVHLYPDPWKDAEQLVSLPLARTRAHHATARSRERLPVYVTAGVKVTSRYTGVVLRRLALIPFAILSFLR